MALPLALVAVFWATLAMADSGGHERRELPGLREAPDIPVANVILHHTTFPDQPDNPSTLGGMVCDKDIDLTSTIAGVVAVGSQDNTICSNSDIDTYVNVLDGETYVVQAGGREAAFTVTHIDANGTPTMIDQISWPQVNTYTPDVKAFVQSDRNYIALSLERLDTANSACGVVFVDVTETRIGNLPAPPLPSVVHQEIGDSPETGGGPWCDVHNSFVEDGPTTGDGRYVYLTADSTKDMRVLDIAGIATADPPEIGRYTSPTAGSGNYVHDITVLDHGGSAGRRVYLSYWDSGLVILDADDVTPGTNPAPIVGPNTIDPAGFMTHHAFASQDGSLAFIQDEFLNASGDQPIQMWDVSDPASPAYVDGLALGTDVPPNPAHNLEIRFDIAPNRLYVGWYRLGLQAWDFTSTGFDHSANPSPRTAVLYHQAQTEPDDGTAQSGTWGVRLANIGDDLYIFQSDQHYGLIVDRVLAPNTPPVALDQTVSIVVDTPVDITLTGSDADTGDTLSFIIVSLPGSGDLSQEAARITTGDHALTGDMVTYTPHTGSRGTDSFTFRVSDGGADSSPATVTVNVVRPLTVTKTGDTNDGSCDIADCSLREAIASGDSGDIIVIPAGTYTLTFGSELTIDTSLTLSGHGADTTIIQAATGEGLATHRVFSITSGDVAISSVTIRHGKASGSFPNSAGGGIYNTGTLTLVNSTVSGNTATVGGGIMNHFGELAMIYSTVSGDTASSSGGGIYNAGGMVTLNNTTVRCNTASGGGGIWTQGVLTLTNSTISSNRVAIDGGGIWTKDALIVTTSTITGNSAAKGGGIYSSSGTAYLSSSTVSDNTAAGEGGGISNNGTLTLTNSTVSGNTASNGHGGGIYNKGTADLTDSTVSDNSASILGGGTYNSGTANFTNSIVSDNTAGNDGGGIRNDGTLVLTNSTVISNTSTGNSGGGINSYSGTLTLTNSTVSGNSALRYGGGILNFGGGTLTLSNSTVSGNSADIAGGGILNDVGTADMVNTIIAGNSAPTSADCSGFLTSIGHNLIGNNSGCGFTVITGDLVNIDSKLGPLQDNGGPTFTHALLPGSPAARQPGSPAIDHVPPENCLVTTDQRGVARPQGVACDIGAFEVIEGDANGDGVVDGADLRVVAAALGASDGADLSGDGLVDIFDLVQVGINFGRGGP